MGSVQRQIEGVQFGAIQMAVLPPEFYAGIDERFEVLTTPGLVRSMAEGQRLAANPQVRDLMLGLGADKGLHGAALFMATQSSIIAKTALRHLADLKGKKIRIFGSQFQSVAMKRLGAVPKPMTLGDVLPALQDNAVDGAVASIAIFNAMHFEDVAKYVTETGQPATFVTVEISKKWYDSLPADLQRLLDKDAAAESVAINPVAIEINDRAAQGLDSQRWRIDQLAARRAVLNAQNPRGRRRRGFERQAATCRSLQNSHRCGEVNGRGERTPRGRFSLSPEQRSSNVCCGQSNGVRS